jgi:hypothetical protein
LKSVKALKIDPPGRLQPENCGIGLIYLGFSFQEHFGVPFLDCLRLGGPDSRFDRVDRGTATIVP